MITNLRLQNFKSLDKVELEPSRITILIGPNNSGKSSVMQALAFLKQSVLAYPNKKIEFNRPLISLGQFWDVVSRHELERVVRIGLSGQNTVEDRVQQTLGILSQDMLYEYEIGISESDDVHDNAASVKWGAFSVHASSVRHGVQGSGAEPPKFDFEGFSCNFSYGSFWNPINFGLSLPSQADRELGARISSSIGWLLGRPVGAIRDTFLIPAGRLIDRPLLNLVDEYSTDLAVSGNLSLQADTVASNLAYRRHLEELISAWLRRITGVSVITRANPGKRVMVETVSPNIAVNVANDGSGTNQLIHLLLQIAITPSESFVMIEEPELNLHPKAQAELAEVLTEIAKKSNRQIVLTTHSEHILFRILNNITEKKISSSDVALYYFSTKDGVARAEKLPIDVKGMIKGGLPGFFQAEVDELTRFLKAVGSVDSHEGNVPN